MSSKELCIVVHQHICTCNHRIDIDSVHAEWINSLPPRWPSLTWAKHKIYPGKSFRQQEFFFKYPSKKMKPDLTLFECTTNLKLNMHVQVVSIFKRL